MTSWRNQYWHHAVITAEWLGVLDYISSKWLYRRDIIESFRKILLSDSKIRISHIQVVDDSSLLRCEVIRLDK